MRLFIFTTDKDRSLPSLLAAAQKYKITPSVVHYALLSFREGEVWYTDKPLRLRKTDRLLVRWPWDARDTRKDYTFFANYFVDRYYERVVLDKKCLADFSPHYEDKLFQASLFKSLSLKTPETWYFSEKKELTHASLPFPLVMKKRISSRGKKTYLIQSPKELLRRIGRITLSEFIFQRYIPFQHDLRLLFLKGEFLGAVNRVAHVRANKRLTVKGGTAYDLRQKNIVKQCQKYAEFIGADFIGFDVLLGQDTKPQIIEANLSPQYERFGERTGVAVSDLIMEDLLRS